MKRIGLSQIIGRLIVTLWALFAVVAIGWIFIASVSTTRGIFSNTLLKEGLHFENYSKIFEKFDMARYFLNSLFYTAGGCIGVILVVASRLCDGKLQLQGKKNHAGGLRFLHGNSGNYADDSHVYGREQAEPG